MTELWVAGVDEVGRGPLAGAVVTAAVILDPEKPIEGLRDSKKLSQKRREALGHEIRDKAIAWALGRSEADEIDRINVLQASLVAMSRAVAALSVEPSEVWVDGSQVPDMPYSVKAVVGGDDLVPAISAASILAKVERDNEMILLDESYPGYGFAKHKGYPTQQHMQALRTLGPCPIHRMSFAPCQRAIRAG